jgi:hypothetical protein
MKVGSLPDVRGWADDRAPVGAKRRRNGRGAKGCRKMDAEKEGCSEE